MNDAPSTRSAAEPLYSVCQLTTPKNDFAEDVAQLARTGAGGIGIWEGKLPAEGDDAARAQLAEAGLRATLCLPQIWSILPSRFAPEPLDLEQRVAQICAGIRRLSAFDPVAYLITGGAQGEHSREAAFDMVVKGVAAIADAAAEVGGAVGYEPIRVRAASPGVVVNTVAECEVLLDAVDRPNVGIVYDVWHLWDEPDRDRLIRANANRIVTVQVNDYRDPSRSWCDRALPGEGCGDVTGIIAALEDGGYDGWYDLEIFSDDGRYGNAFPDSLWAPPHEEMLARARECFDRVWNDARARLGSRP